MGLSPITSGMAAPTTQDLPDDKKAKDLSTLRLRTNLALIAAVLIGVIVAACHGGTITVSLAAFGAALGLGGVLGFLFGVPSNSRPAASRVKAAVVVKPPVDPLLAVPAPQAEEGTAVIEPRPETEDAESTSRMSNLEQVADWVTKLLLGGGLTQMQRIPPKIWQWSRIVALGILSYSKDASEQIIVANQAFAAGLLVYGFILGFFAGFLITKLQLGNAISD